MNEELEFHLVTICPVLGAGLPTVGSTYDKVSAAAGSEKQEPEGKWLVVTALLF